MTTATITTMPDTLGVNCGSYRGHQRKCGQTGIVAYRESRLIGQLGNEMGRPHARAEDRRRHEQP
jgi:hypothetical protein